MGGTDSRALKCAEQRPVIAAIRVVGYGDSASGLCSGVGEYRGEGPIGRHPLGLLLDRLRGEVMMTSIVFLAGDGFPRRPTRASR